MTPEEIANSEIDPMVRVSTCDCPYPEFKSIYREDGSAYCSGCGAEYVQMPLESFEDEVEKLNHLILAAEKWSKQYEKDPESLAGIIKIEAKLERVLRKYFRELADRSDTFINWFRYDVKLREIHASDKFEIDVIIEDGPLGAEDAIVMQTVFDPIAAAVALGAQAGEKIYEYELGLSKTSSAVQKAARELVADLVGKRVDKDGNIVDNPKAKYRVSDKTRQDIRESIRTSLSLGENQFDATSRLRQVIKDPRRAATIARTEAVNSYQEGLITMGKESGATHKEWQSSNSGDICGAHARLKIVKLDYVYSHNSTRPAAHPNCRCSLRLVYPIELES